ncbi:MAG: leucine-rich repeat domain-containing protein, partial [Ruminococcaceae bacterium]|nr:leucine-rich repeat domain-containing protein [Oscillospiraceae bacterium]
LESAQLPSGLRNDIELSLFEGCKALKSIVIPETVTRIYRNAFYGCTALTDPVIPAKVTRIGDSAFYRCENLRYIALPASVKTVDVSAFYDCDRLTRVTMPGVTTIGASAFDGCSQLQYVTLSKALTYINENAFRSCEKLANVYYTGTETNRKNSLGIGNGNYYLTNAVWHYESEGPWPAAIANVTAGTDKITADVTAPVEALLIAASYDSVGRQVDVMIVSVTAGGQADCAVSLKKQSGYTRRLMLVDASTYVPLCAAWSEKG